MRWLIDGYNVIRRDPELRGREAQSLAAGREALLALVAARARSGGDEFTVVFDGARAAGPTAPGRRVQVVFSRPPRTADDELIQLARRLGSGAVVVSSDRAVQDAARRARCPVVTAEQFLDRLAAGAGLEYAAAPLAGAGALPGAADDAAKDDAGDEAPPEKKGNPRRLGKRARAARRALRRLDRS
jgi:predicted RNA-binding protein with PIN domain